MKKNSDFHDRGTLARWRVAASCGGQHTPEFKAWRERALALADELQSGLRKPAHKSRSGARKAGWMLAEEEFRQQHPERTKTMLGFNGRHATRQPLVEEVYWAYQHAMVFSVTEADCPSPGAWLWLLEARENRSAFLGKVFALEQAAYARKLPNGDCDEEADDEELEEITPEQMKEYLRTL